MKYIFFLSGDYIDLGKEEVLSLFYIKDFKLLNNLLIVDLKNNEKDIKKLSNRLALTKKICKLLFECNINDLINSMEKFDWNSVYKNNFCLRINNNKKLKNHKQAEFLKKNLAKYIWRSLKNPKVNLEDPKTKIELFFANDKAYCGLMIFENKEDFESRKAHLRPFPHPSSLHPRVARAVVNLSEIKENEILLDPFCGTGGFLIEAGLMDIKTIGCDINKIMIKGCIENLKHYKIKKYKIENQNALKINGKFDYVITDLPYGLNSNAIIRYDKNDWKKYRLNLKIQKKNFKKNLENFYLLFLKALRKKLRKKAVIIFPSYVNYKKLLKNSKFKIEKEFEQYIHRSLTRKIVKIR